MYLDIEILVKIQKEKLIIDYMCKYPRDEFKWGHTLLAAKTSSNFFELL